MRRVSNPRMVGRDDVLAVLETALERAADGNPRLALVAGDAGVGKTRLARELAGRAGSLGRAVLWGECVPVQAGELPYAPIIAALRGLASPGPVHGELARLMPELVGVPQEAPAANAQARLFELLLGLLGRLAAEVPILLVVEDLHWADGATQDLLRFLARNLHDERLLLLVTLRTDEAVPPGLLGLVGELQRSACAERLDLDPLTRADTALQVAGIVGDPVDGELVAWVHSRAEGNPYFAEELLAARAAGEPGPELPASLRSLLLLRVAGVSDAARRLLSVAATAGREIDHRTLESAAGVDEEALAAALHELLDAHVLVRRGETYAFRHALAREAVHGELLPSERRAMHTALATALDAATPGHARGAADWAALAEHWHGAQRHGPALRASIAAAAAAEQVYAFGAASRQLDRARALWPQVAPEDRPQDLDEIELLRRLADAARLAGDGESAIPAARAAVALVDPVADPRRAAALHELLGRLHRAREPALREFERALALLPAEPSPERASVMLRIVVQLRHGQLPSLSRSWALDALAVAQAAGAVAEEGRAHEQLGGTLAYGGDAVAAVEHFHEAIRIATMLGNGDDLGAALNNLGDALSMLGRVDDAVATFETGLEEMRRAGLTLSYGVYMEANLAECELHLGRWHDARARLERLLDGPVHMDMERLTLLAHRITLEAREGCFEAAAEHERQALALFDANVWAHSIEIANCARAELALLRGDPATARSIVAETRRRVVWGDIVDWPALLALGVRAEADLAIEARAYNQEELSAAARATAVEFLGADDVPGSLKWYRFEDPVEAPAPPETLAHRLVGDGELARLDADPRPDLWEQAAARWEALRFPYQAAYARFRQAEAILAAGGVRADAATALQTAHAACVQLGAAPLRDEIEALARRARLPLTADHGHDATERPFGLTERELIVLAHLAAGHTNRQIAGELFLSTRTVDMHVRNILPKLNAANRVQAAATAHRLGLDTARLP